MSEIQKLEKSYSDKLEMYQKAVDKLMEQANSLSKLLKEDTLNILPQKELQLKDIDQYFSRGAAPSVIRASEENRQFLKNQVVTALARVEIIQQTIMQVKDA